MKESTFGKRDIKITISQGGKSKSIYDDSEDEEESSSSSSVSEASKDSDPVIEEIEPPQKRPFFRYEIWYGKNYSYDSVIADGYDILDKNTESLCVSFFVYNPKNPTFHNQVCIMTNVKKIQTKDR